MARFEDLPNLGYDDGQEDEELETIDEGDEEGSEDVSGEDGKFREAADDMERAVDNVVQQINNYNNEAEQQPGFDAEIDREIDAELVQFNRHYL